MGEDNSITVGELKNKVREFIHARAWEKYHNPKDVSESICIEAAELLERFQWTTSQEALAWKNDQLKVESISDEIADVIIYCFSLANTLNIDLSKAVLKKLESNERKYPAEKYRGKWYKSSREK